MMVFKGQVTEEDLVQAEEELREELPRISPVFDMISDVSAAEKLSPVAIERIRRMGELIVASGLRTHVRVVGRSGQAAVQFQRIARTVGECCSSRTHRRFGYDSRLAYSVKEAEELLDGSP